MLRFACLAALLALAGAPALGAPRLGLPKVGAPGLRLGAAPFAVVVRAGVSPAAGLAPAVSILPRVVPAPAPRVVPPLAAAGTLASVDGRGAGAFPAAASPRAIAARAYPFSRAPLERIPEESARFFDGGSASEPTLPASARDRTEALLRAYAEEGPAPRRARRYRYLLVPGLAWDAVPDYLQPNLKRLRELGLDAEIVRTDPLGDSAHNAREIARRIRLSDKPVVLIAHSKGGLDALRALESDSSAARRVSRLVALQTPYFGSAVADWFLARPLLMNAAAVYTRALNPWRLLATFPLFRGATLREMSRAERGGLPDRRPPIRAGIRLYSVASRVSSSASVKLLLWISAGLVKRLTERDNDGIVNWPDALVPGSDYALLDGVGHLDAVSDPTNWKRKRLGVRDDAAFAGDLTEALLRWIFTPSGPAARAGTLGGFSP